MLTILFVITAAVLVIGFLSQAFALWLSCKICRARSTAAQDSGVRFRRIFFVCLALTLTNLVLLGTWLFVCQQLRGDSLLFGELLINVLAIVLVFGWVWQGLQLRFGRAVLVFLVWVLFSAGLTVGIVYGIKTLAYEGFVIPTGSMAETLLGYHKHATCPECGLAFPVDASMEAEPAFGQYPRVEHCVCPNCRKQIDLTGDPEAMELRPGDRILTTAGVLGRSRTPSRYDLVIFNQPGRPSAPGRSPLIQVKRLIGIPGETIAICRGKLFHLPADKSGQHEPPAVEKSSADDGPFFDVNPERLQAMAVNHSEDVERFRKGEFQILRKPTDLVLTMMRLVYDNDHQARDLQKDPSCCRWREEKDKTWLDDESFGFRHAGAAAEPRSWLRYHQHTRDDARDTVIHPVMGYNSSAPPFTSVLREWVGDLILECEATIDKPAGAFVMELSRGPDRFQAQWNLADGICTLYRVTTEKDRQARKEELGQKTTVLTQGTHRLRFANVDQRLIVWLDGNLIFGDGVAYDVPAPPRATDNDLQPASIGASEAGIQVKHLKLFHDTYYSIPDYRSDMPGEVPVMTMYVQPGHYLVLGDNSFHSSDSRIWGLVPEDHLRGQAVLVYYPLSRIGRVR